MNLKEFKTWLNTLPEDTEIFPQVHGMVAIVSPPHAPPEPGDNLFSMGTGELPAWRTLYDPSQGN